MSLHSSRAPSTSSSRHSSVFHNHLLDPAPLPASEISRISPPDSDGEDLASGLGLSGHGLNGRVHAMSGQGQLFTSAYITSGEIICTVFTGLG
jgi:hypothetical protein